MSVISTDAFTARLSRRLKRAGIPLWVAKTSGDKWGKYLLFRVGGKCVAGCGWSRREAEEKVAQCIAEDRTHKEDILAQPNRQQL